jgi:hypothetical protein
MTSGGMIYTPSFMNISSGILKLSREDTHARTHTHTEQSDLMSLLVSFFRNKESKLKRKFAFGKTAVIRNGS